MYTIYSRRSCTRLLAVNKGRWAVNCHDVDEQSRWRAAAGDGDLLAAIPIASELPEDDAMETDGGGIVMK